MNTNDALTTVFARNTFYRRLHYLVLATLALAITVIGILLGILVHMLRYPNPPLYFATDDVGRLIHVVPVDTPNMSQQDVINWVIDALQNALSFDFINFRAQLQNAQRYFTDFGWRNYMDAQKATNNFVALDTRKMVFLAQVIGQPTLVTQGILGGAYAWKFDMPVIMTYLYPPYDDKSRYTNSLDVSVVVQRQPILQSYRGLGIVQVIANLGAGNAPAQPFTGAAPTTGGTTQ